MMEKLRSVTEELDREMSEVKESATGIGKVGQENSNEMQNVITYMEGLEKLNATILTGMQDINVNAGKYREMSENVEPVSYTHLLEKEAAESLIADGCVLISQHADTTGASTACEKAGVPIVGYNVSMIATAPTQALTSASIDWGPYYTYAVKSVIDGTKIDTDWCKGYDDGADKITELNDKAIAKGTKEKVKEVEDARCV